MKGFNKLNRKKQKGAVTIFTSVILLIAITLVTFLTAKTVLQETKIAANNQRAQQAFAEADGAMDYAIAYFNGGGFDHDGDGTVDTIPALGTSTITLSAGTCTLSAKAALITTTGTSDDGIASRSISQCVGTRNLLKGGGPKQSMVSGASVGLTGSAQIINRYSDLNIWSASSTSIGSSSAMDTYIRPTDVEISDLTEEELADTTTSPSILNVQKVSSNGLGAGTDVYMGDDRLVDAMAVTNASKAAGDDGVVGDGSMFDLFFADNKAGVANLADGISPTQRLVGADDCKPDGMNGVIWVDGDAKCTGGQIGVPPTYDASGNVLTVGVPALLVIDGDFDMSGAEIYGLLYVTGTLTVTGNPKVQGTMIAEGSIAGTGTVTLVYARNIGNGSDAPLKGTTAIVSGSWRDW